MHYGPEPVNVTLEPNENNPDGVALTLYFEGEVVENQVKSWCREGGSHLTHFHRLGLWVDTDDSHFCATQEKAGPHVKANLTRWQAHPTC